MMYKRTQTGWKYLTIGAIAGVSLWYFAQSDLMLQAHAWVARSLLHTAWVRTQASGRQVKPWPWADTWPLARLSIPRLETEWIILANSGENTSRYALGHLESSVLPGEVGNSGVKVPKDIYFNSVISLRLGDILELESLQTGRWHYRVSAIYIVDKGNTKVLEPCSMRRLTLVSCYPCNKPGNNNLRYVVIAEETERLV
jgi:sortase A